ncbi:hypothetical protein EDD15DRAFT_754379 [Pisolithus albus]|nr:hypothetical protein EDD15DRAFT_754379 [Pisolithus albus]
MNISFLKFPARLHHPQPRQRDISTATHPSLSQTGIRALLNESFRTVYFSSHSAQYIRRYQPFFGERFCRTKIGISRDWVRRFPCFHVLPSPYASFYHPPRFRRIRPSGSPPTRCCPPIPYPIRRITHAPLDRISRFSQTLIYQTTPIRRYTRRCECIPGSRVIRTFVFGQDSEVRFTYLARFPVEPLALLHGGTTCSRLPGDAIFMASRSFVAEIWVFSVYRGV